MNMKEKEKPVKIAIYQYKVLPETKFYCYYKFQPPKEQNTLRIQTSIFFKWQVSESSIYFKVTFPNNRKQELLLWSTPGGNMY